MTKTFGNVVELHPDHEAQRRARELANSKERFTLPELELMLPHTPAKWVGIQYGRGGYKPVYDVRDFTKPVNGILKIGGETFPYSDD